MFSRKQPKAFVGTIGSGLPYEDFETALEAPDSVRENLEKMRPMIKAIRAMAETEGWKMYVQPFLEKQKNSTKILELVKAGQDARAEAGKTEAFVSILNLVNSFLRTGDSLDKMDAAEEQKRADQDKEAL